MRKGNFRGPDVKEMYLSLDLYVFQICSACKQKTSIVLKSLGYNRVLFS